MLVETLLVTSFIIGVLIYLFVQFTNLSSSYSEYFIYNTSEGLYALEDIKNYIESDTAAYDYIAQNIEGMTYMDIKNCEIFTDTEYCLRLIQFENISKLYVMPNPIQGTLYFSNEGLLKFVRRINLDSDEPYRLVAEFNNATYATLRFGTVSN